MYVILTKYWGKMNGETYVRKSKYVHHLWKRPHERPRRRWEDNVKIDRKEVRSDDVNGIRLAEDRVQWHAFVDTVMNLQFP
jgi:hypothetical protein